MLVFGECIHSDHGELNGLSAEVFSVSEYPNKSYRFREVGSVRVWVSEGAYFVISKLSDAVRQYRPSIATLVLLGAGIALFHLDTTKAWVLVVFYMLADCIDQASRRNAIDKAIDEEISGWKPSSEGHEDKGAWTRIKLPDKDQVVVTRVAYLVQRIVNGR
jgi:hypothetical protein